MLVAVTGASGFIGSYIVAALKRAGHEVRAMVRPANRRDHIAGSVDQWCVGDVDDPQARVAVVAGAQAVVHNAADWTALKEGPVPHFRKNVLASLELLEAARQAQVGQFLFISSGAVYDEILPDRPLDENHPTWPGSIYGAYKASVEPFLKAYHKSYGMNTSSWRPVAVYGVTPRLENSPWFDLIKTARDGGRILTAQGGKITHVNDIADAMVYALGDEAVAGHFFNLVDCYMYWQMAAEFAKEFSGSAATIEDRKGTGPRNQYDTRKALAFFDRHGNTTALRHGTEGVKAYVRQVLAALSK